MLVGGALTSLTCDDAELAAVRRNISAHFSYQKYETGHRCSSEGLFSIVIRADINVDGPRKSDIDLRLCADASLVQLRGRPYGPLKPVASVLVGAVTHIRRNHPPAHAYSAHNRRMVITPAIEEFAARLGQAGVCADSAKLDAIFEEIRVGGIEAALAVLTVQTRNLVWMLRLTQGDEGTRALFERTITDAQAACDDAWFIPNTAPDQAPKFEPVDFTVTEADNIRRQDSDAEGWSRGAVRPNYRP